MTKKTSRAKNSMANQRSSTMINESESFEYTIFNDHHAKKMNTYEVTFSQFCKYLKEVHESEKESSPLIKMATFNGKRTSGGSLRSNSAIRAITGVEGDYDGGEVSPQVAAKRLEKHSVRAIVVTTHSYEPKAPRWRVFAPLSRPRSPDERSRLLDSLNRILGGILARESWTVSQGYYIGRPPNGEYKTQVTFDDPEWGMFLDEIVGDVEAEDSKPSFDNIENIEKTGVSDSQALTSLLDGEDVHGNALKIVGKLVSKGLDDSFIKLFMRKLADEVKQQRGKQRATCLVGHELDRMISGARNKGFGSALPVPLPDGRPPVHSFHPELLPPSLRSYVEDVTERTQCPMDFVAVVAVCGLSAALGNKARICPKQQDDDWQVTPNLWGAIIGRPSAMKSPSMKAALEPLRQIEERAKLEHEEELSRHNFALEVAEVQRQGAKRKAQELAKKGDNAGAKRILEEEVSEPEPHPIRSRVIVNDASVEKLGDLLNQNPDGLLLVRDELYGLLSKLNREEHQQERAFYLTCFNGSDGYTYDRIGRGTIDIKHCTLSIIGGIQPSKLASTVRGTLNGTQNDGLMERFQLAVWPDDLKKWKYVDRAPDESCRKVYFDAFERMRAFDADRVGCFRFSTEAQPRFKKWLEELRNTTHETDIHTTLESHLIKMEKTIASLALIFELVEGGKEEVRKPALKRALKWYPYLRSHAERIYTILRAGEIEGAKLILDRRNRLGEEFSAREIQRKGWTGLDTREAVKAALECLADHNYIQPCNSRPPENGGRPTTIYQWNPALSSEF